MVLARLARVFGDADDDLFDGGEAVAADVRDCPMTLNACPSGAGINPAHSCIKYSVYSLKRAGTTPPVFRWHDRLN